MFRIGGRISKCFKLPYLMKREQISLRREFIVVAFICSACPKLTFASDTIFLLLDFEAFGQEINEVKLKHMSFHKTDVTVPVASLHELKVTYLTRHLPVQHRYVYKNLSKAHDESNRCLLMRNVVMLMWRRTRLDAQHHTTFLKPSSW